MIQLEYSNVEPILEMQCFIMFMLRKAGIAFTSSRNVACCLHLYEGVSHSLLYHENFNVTIQVVYDVNFM